MSRTGNLPGKNIRALIPDFLEARSHKIRTKASRTGYRERLSLLADFLDNPPVNRVTEDDLVRFCGAGKAVQSQLARRTAVRSFFSWAYRAGLVTVDPAAHLNDVFDVKVKNSRKATWLNEGQVGQLLAAQDDPRVVIGLMLALFTGLRASELVGLTWGDVDLANRTIWVVGKGEKGATIGVPRQLVDAFEEWRRHWTTEAGEPPRLDDPIIPRMRSTWISPLVAEVVTDWHVALGYAGYRLMVKEAGEKAGIPNLAPHDLRRTFAGLLEAKGVPIQDISRALRHSDVGTTQRYLETNPRKTIEATQGFELAI